MSPDYIPAKVADKALWIANFSALLTAVPTDYGLTAPNALAVQNAADDFAASYAVSSNPATRTAPAIAQTNLDLAAVVGIIRPYAVRIAANPSVSDLNKGNIGVTIRSTVRTPIPPPTTSPAITLESGESLVHNLRYNDATTPTSKAKPFGSIGIELFAAVGVAAAVDPSVAPYKGTYTKSPLQVQFQSGDRGKIATYFARWVTRAGAGGKAAAGPWGAPVSFTVM